MPPKFLVLILTVLASVTAACGGVSGGSTGGDTRPTVAVTHSILGDVVEQATGGQVEVVTIMGPNTDPHEFSPSARDVNKMQTADALIVNGGGFEVGLLDAIDGARADGVATFEALAAVSPLDLPSGPDGSTGVDPHFFTDPARMADAVGGITAFLAAEIDDIDVAALQAASDAYRAELLDLDAETEALLAPLPADDRILVTNHEVFGYFADRYGLTVLGTVIPGGSTGGAASASQLADLADTIRDTGVAAIFVERSSASDLAETVAAEVGAVTVTPLFSESLGEPGSGGATYLELMRTNSSRIAAALGGERS